MSIDLCLSRNIPRQYRHDPCSGFPALVRCSCAPLLPWTRPAYAFSPCQPGLEPSYLIAIVPIFELKPIVTNRCFLAIEDFRR